MVRSLQTVAIARFFSIVATAWRHIFSAKDDITNYKTISHFWNAVNTKSSYKSSFIQLRGSHFLFEFFTQLIPYVIYST